jgi:3-hydroxyacyl-[acyl-carrier-protein] dehydratase
MNAPEPQRHAAEFRVGAEHPALPGHFPGRPVVPGVVILDEVIACAERWLGRELAVTGLPQAKFVGVLEPERDARVTLTLAGTSLKFDVQGEAGPLASGAFTLAPGSFAPNTDASAAAVGESGR